MSPRSDSIEHLRTPPLPAQETRIQAGRFGNLVEREVECRGSPLPSVSLLKQPPPPRPRQSITTASPNPRTKQAKGSVRSHQHYHKTKPLTMVESSSGPRSAAPTGFFRVPNLFVRLSSKSLGNNNGADPDPVWSPTSPLDNLRSSPRPRVGLGLVDALTAEAGSLLSGGKTSFLDSIRPFLERGLPSNKPAATASKKDAPTADKIADSEEYTCVIARGANPRTTHILGGETLEVRAGGPSAGGCGKVVFTVEPFTDRPALAPAGVASGRCRCCMRRLPESRDIFIYKGEMAFCSNECREGYIEEEVEDVQDVVTLKHTAAPPLSFSAKTTW